MSLWIEAGAEALLLIGPYAVLVIYAVMRKRRVRRKYSKKF
jgi:hypothetical protein